MSDDARNKILARRAKFVAAALAGASIAGCAPDQPPGACLSPPQPCLSVQPDDTGPQVCLEPMPPPPEDAGDQPLEPEKKPGPFADPPPG